MWIFLGPKIRVSKADLDTAERLINEKIAGGGCIRGLPGWAVGKELPDLEVCLRFRFHGGGVGSSGSRTQVRRYRRFGNDISRNLKVVIKLQRLCSLTRWRRRRRRRRDG